MANFDLTFYHGTDDYSDGDYEENYNNNDLPFPQLERYFDDTLITADLD